MRAIRPNINPEKFMNHRVPQFYELAIEEVFGVKAAFSFGINFDIVTEYLEEGKGIIICLKEPGHYIAPVAYTENTLIYRDSWSGNKWPERHIGKSGFNRDMTREEFKSNVQPFKVVIGG